MLPVLDLAVRLLAKVAGGRDNDDAGVDRALGGQRQRIGQVRLGHLRANREVDDADVVRDAVRNRPLEGSNDVADDAAAILIEHLQADDVGRRSDAGAGAVRVIAVAGDDARHVRAMPVVVVRRRQSVDEVDERRRPLAVHHAHLAVGALIRHVVVQGGDAGVDDRDADAGAVVAVLLTDGAGADRHRGTIEVLAGRPIVVDADDFRALGQGLDDPVRQLHDHAVDQLQLAADTAAQLPHFLAGVGVLSRLDLDDDAGGAQEPSRTSLQLLVYLLGALRLPPVTLPPRTRACVANQGDGEEPDQHGGWREPFTYSLSNTH